MLKLSPRTRQLVAVACIALVVFAAVLPALAGSFVAILVPLGLVVQAVTVTAVRRTAQRSDEQPLSLRSLLPSRAPPTSLALA